METTNQMVMKEFFGDITSNKYLKVLFSILLDEYSNKVFGKKFQNAERIKLSSKSITTNYFYVGIFISQ